jgi:hypothetical protein
MAMNGIRPNKQRQNCLGSTCMKWTPSGELSELDLHHVLQRLARVDANLAVMSSCHLDEQPHTG